MAFHEASYHIPIKMLVFMAHVTQHTVGLLKALPSFYKKPTEAY